MDLRSDVKTKNKVRLRAGGNCSVCNKPTSPSLLAGWLKTSQSCHCSKSDKHQNKNEDDGTVIGDSPENFPDLGSNFEILELLGQGGMGQVFKVKNKTDGSILAVKVLRSELADDKEALKRFEQEISAVANLTHENLIAVHSQGRTAGGAPFLVMDYIDGTNLSEYLKQNSGITDSDAVQIFYDLAKALEAAHAGGILHRDLKPSNVMIRELETGTKSAKLADFGISKLMPSESTVGRETSDLTKTGDIFGTPGYMSPEQCLGFKLDERSDIYSLGCMMYETLSGTAPFDAENPIQTVIKQINDEPAAWVNARGDKFGKKLESIVLKCLEKQPENRYQSAQELLSELDRLRRGEKITAGVRKKEKKAHLSKMQFLGAVSYSFYIFAFLATTATGDFSILNLFVMVMPFCILFLLKAKKRFGLPQTELVQWLIVRAILGVGLGVLALMLFPVTHGFFESMPAALQFIPVLMLFSVFVLVMLFAATMVAELFGGQEKRVTLRAVCKKLVLPAVLGLIPLYLIVPGTFQTIADYMIAGMRYHEHLSPYKCRSPKFAYALLQFSNLFHAKNRDGALLEASCLSEQNKREEAIKVLTDTIPTLKHPEDLRIKRAEIYDADNQHDKALADLSDLNSTTTDWYHQRQVLKALGDHYFNMGDFKKAEDVYTSAIEKASYSKGPVYEARAAAKWRSGNKDGAIHDLSKAYADRSFFDQPETVLIKRGICNELNGDAEAARKDFLSAQDIMARNRETLDSWSLTVAQFTEMYGYNEHIGEVLLKKAIVSKKLGQTDIANKCIEDAKKFHADKDAFFSDFKERFAIDNVL